MALLPQPTVKTNKVTFIINYRICCLSSLLAGQGESVKVRATVKRLPRPTVADTKLYQCIIWFGLFFCTVIGLFRTVCRNRQVEKSELVHEQQHEHSWN